MFDRRHFLFAAAAVGMTTAACARPAKAAQIHVYKTPTCGCCTAWVDHLRFNGFAVAITDMDDVSPIARKLGVPGPLRSCHTAEVGGYFLEGHVPASDIRKLLREKPDARGVVVPGMPVGTPGMEQGDRREPFVTLIVERDGRSHPFVDHAS